MKSNRKDMTVRIVPLDSDEASDGRVTGSITESMALVGELTRRTRALTGKPVPSYTRATIPFKLTTLRAK